MNYRHSFHAGNFVDVHKHLVLMALLQSLCKKDKAFCYIDTHAGAGCYDLHSENAHKTMEHQNGIQKIISAANTHAPEMITNYLNCISNFNSSNEITYYPGSPLIAQYCLRAGDRMIACELHPEEYRLLKSNFKQDKRVAIHHIDGYLSVKAFLPPKEKRGLMLIDPPYEKTNEFEQIVHALTIATKRWANGIYAIWYPIKESKSVADFHKKINNLIGLPYLITELTLYPLLEQRLNGSGLIILNPPWQLQETINTFLPWVWKILSIENQGEYSTYLSK